MRAGAGSPCQLAGAWLEQQGGELGLRRYLGASGALCCPRCAAPMAVCHSGKVNVSLLLFPTPKPQDKSRSCTAPAHASLEGRALPSKTHPINSIAVALPKPPQTIPGLFVLPGAGQATVLTWPAQGSRTQVPLAAEAAFPLPCPKHRHAQPQWAAETDRHVLFP